MANRRNQTLDLGLTAYQQTFEGMRLLIPQDDLNPLNVRDASIDPFITTGTVQKFPLGTELVYGDRKFRYAKAGGTGLAVGKLMQSVVPLAGHIKQVIAAAAAGDTTITFTPLTPTTNDLTLNELAGGYIYINAGTGQGYAYRIKSHPAITGGAAGVLTLYDPIVIATPASATATVVHHPLRGIILHPSPPTAPPVGVTVCAWAANEYGWLQYWGPCPVLTDGTVVIKNMVVPSANTDGAVMANIDFQLETVVGQVMAVNATTEYSLINLSIL